MKNYKLTLSTLVMVFVFTIMSCEDDLSINKLGKDQALGTSHVREYEVPGNGSQITNLAMLSINCFYGNVTASFENSMMNGQIRSHQVLATLIDWGGIPFPELEYVPLVVKVTYLGAGSPSATVLKVNGNVFSFSGNVANGYVNNIGDCFNAWGGLDVFTTQLTAASDGLGDYKFELLLTSGTDHIFTVPTPKTYDIKCSGQSTGWATWNLSAPLTVDYTDTFDIDLDGTLIITGPINDLISYDIKVEEIGSSNSRRRKFYINNSQVSNGSTTTITAVSGNVQTFNTKISFDLKPGKNDGWVDAEYTVFALDNACHVLGTSTQIVRSNRP